MIGSCFLAPSFPLNLSKNMTVVKIPHSRRAIGLVINTWFIRNICFKYKWQTETYNNFLPFLLSYLQKKFFKTWNQETSPIYHQHLRSRIRENTEHAHTDIQSRTETEREELLLVASFLMSFRRSRTKTLTGRSQASWRTALQTNKEKRTGSWSWNDRTEESETDKEKDSETDRHNLDSNLSEEPEYVTIILWLTITHTTEPNQLYQALLITERHRKFLHLHRSDERILSSSKHLF